ncbi:MAG: hypothetical protein ABI651_13610 [Verrucomicrobiota bacterium]
MITTLAASAVSVLAPYLVQVGATAVEDLAKGTGNKILALYQALKHRFQGNTIAAEALTDLEKAPSDEDAQAALRQQLKKQMEADPSFLDELKQLMEDVKQDNQSISFLTNVYGGKVEKIINVGTVGGDLHID